MANYGDNFLKAQRMRTMPKASSRCSFLDYGTQGTDDEWTPVNTSKNATQARPSRATTVPADTAAGPT